ncbi:MAG: hypothetical protein RMI89_11825 [Gloeomargarita sp. SKYBB_i_bin120]|nr:hypothetical protein [Gloeomargarita sp. SKYG98]MCS7293634.1 hypothetical protein [Gloeomargarita sp. SKYB120]MDW8179200.1 hypothetical protein [Gloeomargarita sp. SKYBB_i_bin120]
MTLGAPALADPGYGYGYGHPVVFPYKRFALLYPSPVFPRGGSIYVAPLQTTVVVPSTVTLYPYVSYNSRIGFSYGFTAIPQVTVVGGYVTPLYGPGFVIYPNAPRY